MKKVFTLIAVLMLFGAATAQENSEKPKKSFEIGIKSGMTYFGGYPSLSLYENNMPDYLSKLGLSVDFKRSYDEAFWGMEIGICDAYTSVTESKEVAELAHLAVTAGYSIPLKNGWEIPLEAKLGPTMMVNEILDEGKTKGFYRWGAMVGYGFGINYRLPHVCIGLFNEAFVGGNFANKVTLPDGSENNRENGPWFFGYKLMLRIAFVD